MAKNNRKKDTIADISIAQIKEYVKRFKNRVIAISAVTFLIIYYIIATFFLRVIEGYAEVGIGNYIVIFLYHPSVIIWGIIGVIVANILVMWLTRVNQKPYEKDAETGKLVATSNSLGSAQKNEFGKQEFEESINYATYEDMVDNILGGGKTLASKGLLYAIKAGYGINGNLAIFGSPGSGKSRCYIIPTILQTIRRGESLIITDPKGELYGKVAELARAHGYTVKIFNTNPRQMKHSDSCNLLGIIKEDTFLINTFVKTIMANISGTVEEDFWSKSQLNELKFVTTYVATGGTETHNEDGVPKTLGGVFQVLNSYSVEELEDKFFSLPDDHPAKPAFNTWQQGDKTVKGNTHAGLQIDLAVLAEPLVQMITGYDDIDLSLPGKEKCIYFVSMSDQERSMQFLVALFFTLTFQELVNYADGRRQRCLKTKVTMLLDEFYNIGLIPDFDSKISQVRSRGIDCVIVLQSLAQLQKMYPDNMWEGILDCCSTTMLLATRSYLTAEYFSKFYGEQTVFAKSWRREGLKGTQKEKLYETVTETETRQPMYTPHEIITKNKNIILVSTSTYNVIEMKKLDYSEHPMCKEIREVIAQEHIPNWVKSADERTREKFKLDNEVYVEEGGWDIELCTEEDFKEVWTKEKQKKLDEKIKQDRIRLGRVIVYDDDDDEYSQLDLLEDREVEDDRIFEYEEDSEEIDIKAIRSRRPINKERERARRAQYVYKNIDAETGDEITFSSNEKLTDEEVKQMYKERREAIEKKQNENKNKIDKQTEVELPTKPKKLSTPRTYKNIQPTEVKQKKDAKGRIFDDE